MLTSNSQERTPETVLARVEELCQARRTYNEHKLKQTKLLPNEQDLQHFQGSLNYAIRHYLTQIVLIKKMSPDIQTVLDQLYLHCFSYEALERHTNENLQSLSKAVRKRFLSNLPSWVSDILDLDFHESPFLKDIKKLLKPLISTAMNRFIRDYTLTFTTVQGSTKTLWMPDLSTSFLDTELPNFTLLVLDFDEQQRSSMLCILDEDGALNIQTVIERLGQLIDYRDTTLAVALQQKDVVGFCEGYKKLYDDFSKLKTDIELYPDRFQPFKDFLIPLKTTATATNLTETPKTESIPVLETKPPTPLLLSRDSIRRDHATTSIAAVKQKTSIKTEPPAAPNTPTAVNDHQEKTPAIPAENNPIPLINNDIVENALPKENLQPVDLKEKKASSDIAEKTRLYWATVEEQRKIKALDEKEKQKKLKEETEKRAMLEEAQNKLSTTAQAQQTLKAAFIRLSPLNKKNLDLLEEIVGIPKEDGSAPDQIPCPTIPYRSLATLFPQASNASSHVGTLGYLESSGTGGSHRKISLPALASFDDVLIERLGFFDYKTPPSPGAAVKGTTVQPHGSTHTDALSPTAIDGIRSTLNRAGITAITLQAFQKAKAIATDAPVKEPLALLALYQTHNGSVASLSPRETPRSKKKINP